MKSKIATSLVWIVAVLSFVYALTYHPAYNEVKEIPPPVKEATPTEYCINGVLYYYLGRGLAPAFNKHSKVRTCNERRNTDPTTTS